MSKDVDAVFSSSASDWDVAVADIRAVLIEIAADRNAVLDADELAEASERGLRALAALHEEDPRPAIQELTSATARLGEVLEAASPSLGGWYQLIDRLQANIAALRDLH